MSAVPGPDQHATLYTVIAEQPGERRLERYRDPVDAQRRSDQLRQLNWATQVLPPSGERKAA